MTSLNERGPFKLTKVTPQAFSLEGLDGTALPACVAADGCAPMCCLFARMIVAPGLGTFLVSGLSCFFCYV
jgi:hypothetical protein